MLSSVLLLITADSPIGMLGNCAHLNIGTVLKLHTFKSGVELQYQGH
jgi:hypothetical protein